MNFVTKVRFFYDVRLVLEPQDIVANTPTFRFKAIVDDQLLANGLFGKAELFARMIQLLHGSTKCLVHLCAMGDLVEWQCYDKNKEVIWLCHCQSHAMAPPLASWDLVLNGYPTAWVNLVAWLDGGHRSDDTGAFACIVRHIHKEHAPFLYAFKWPPCVEDSTVPETFALEMDLGCLSLFVANPFDFDNLNSWLSL